MRCHRPVVFLALVIAMSCGDASPRQDAPADQRSLTAVPDAVASVLPAAPIDWSQSGGVFIGVQTFHDGSGLAVPWAADDAVDLARLFTQERQLLPPEHVTLLLAGRPAKASSRASLKAMRGEVTLIEDRHGAPPIACVDAPTILAAVRAEARKVGPRGVLIVSFAGHGISYRGEHHLITAEASMARVRGVVLARVLDAVAAERTKRLVLLIDACRRQPRQGTPWPELASLSPAMPETFLEEVSVPFAYAVLSSTKPGGFA